jgi:hypothetical protein
MQITEQTEFQGHVARLCAGLGVPPTEERQAAFWTAFKVLSLLEFSRMVDQALSENGLKGKPDVPAMWALRASMKARPVPGQPPPPATIEPSFGVKLVDSMFMTYVYQRKFVEQFKGDINMAARRQKCRELAGWIDGMKAEDMLPTLPECMTAFGNAMKSVADVLVESRELVDG